MALFGSKSDAAEKTEALRKSGFKGPIDNKGDAVMSRTDGKGDPLPLFGGGDGDGHGTKDDKRR
jgi:hypothetical protein